MALNNLKDTLLVNLEALFTEYVIAPFGLLKRGKGKGFERHKAFQIHFYSLISLCKDFFKTSSSNPTDRVCFHCNKYIVYTCNCNDNPSSHISHASPNNFCFTCLVLHVHCDKYFSSLPDTLLSLCDVHVKLVLNLGLFLLLVYGDVIHKPFIVKRFLFDVVHNTYTNLDNQLKCINKPMPSSFYYDMVSYLYEHATRCISPRARVRICLAQFYRCFLTLNDVYPDRLRVCMDKEFGCAPRTAKTFTRQQDIFTHVEYFVSNIEVAKSCASTCRICTKSVQQFVHSLNLAM